MTTEGIVSHLPDSALGTGQTFENLTVLPLTIHNEDGPDYLTLGQAMSSQLLVITEINEGGSVPDLKVMNKSDHAVLLLDGEELVGAKQNRVLNTTILIKAKSETIVPVSCTEQGRWSYLSEEFADSGTVMSPSVRQFKVRSVSESLRSTGNRHSDQGEVWDEIDKLSLRAGVQSDTSAMRDVHESKKKQLSDYCEAIQLVEGQTGLLVLVSDQVVGLDCISQPSAFAELYPKLLKSYAMDAILSESNHSSKDPIRLAKDFLRDAGSANKTVHDSVGYGQDLRFTGDSIVGSGLQVDQTMIHVAFFCSQASERGNRMSSSRNRRRFRG